MSDKVNRNGRFALAEFEDLTKKKPNIGSKNISPTNLVKQLADFMKQFNEAWKKGESDNKPCCA